MKMEIFSLGESPWGTCSESNHSLPNLHNSEPLPPPEAWERGDSERYSQCDLCCAEIRRSARRLLVLFPLRNLKGKKDVLLKFYSSELSLEFVKVKKIGECFL